MTATARAAPGDLDVLLTLVEEFCLVDHHPFDRERVTGAVAPLLVDDALGQVWLVLDEARAAVGYAVVTWGYSLESGGRDALLDELYVRPRGRGLGSRALDEILGACRAHGASRMFLETEAHNERVRRFYARLGFRLEDSIWMSRDL